MKRDLKELSDNKFDIIIIGAGIYGAALAWEASLRGLSVALIDRGDFGAATSANSLKIMHGGLRYLQQMDIKRFRESIRERHLLLRLAPHLVSPMPCVLPTTGHKMKGPEVMAVGLLLNDILSCDRNKGVDHDRHIPRGRIVSRKRCLELAPGLDPQGINGGAFWSDAQAYSSERLLLAFIKTAVEIGCVAANYLGATSLIRRESRIEGVQVEDRLQGDRFEIRGDIIINTAGAWVDDLLGKNSGSGPLLSLSTAMNLVVKRKLLQETALGFQAPFTFRREDGSIYNGRRVLFMAPWRDYTLIGTYHLPYSGHPSDMQVKEEEIQGFLEEINKGYPGDPVKREDVSHVYKGFLPMNGLNPTNGEVSLVKHYRILDHAKEDRVENLISVVGVKYTTARDVAEKTLRLALAKLGKSRNLPLLRPRYLCGGNISSFSALLSEARQGKPTTISEETATRMTRLYGADYPDLMNMKGIKLQSLNGYAEAITSEIYYAVREEMAVTLSDILLRRTDIGSGSCPQEETLRQVAAIAGKELGWDAARTQAEIDDLKAVYETTGKSE